jgi:hypothetical protein
MLGSMVSTKITIYFFIGEPQKITIGLVASSGSKTLA